jgi:magnesium-transporting ATPase (P-type)
LLKEGYDDFNRWVRDRDTNNESYGLLTKRGIQPIKWMQLKVGQIIEVHANQTLPADCVLLWTNDISETIFIRTDQ